MYHASTVRSTYRFLGGNGVAQVYGELAHVDEGVLIRHERVEREELDERSLHEVDERQRRRRRELAVLHVRHVHLLQTDSSH